ncbi:MAG: 50S ribosomal protein L22 [Spirochaetota bacterium]
MEAKAISRYNRISSSKARLVANEIKGYSYPEAVDALKAMPQKASELILKTLHSAGANAKYKNPDILEDSLYIKMISIDVGPTLKRFRARARGRAARIRKRTSHILVVLSD